MSIRVEPKRHILEEWANGAADMYMLPYEYANWAYWYLGYDDPDFLPTEHISNGVVVKLTRACQLRLQELNND